MSLREDRGGWRPPRNLKIRQLYADSAAQQLVMVSIPGVSVVRVDILRIVYRPEGDERNAWNNILV
jgi:hypothetical protein